MKYYRLSGVVSGDKLLTITDLLRGEVTDFHAQELKAGDKGLRRASTKVAYTKRSATADGRVPIQVLRDFFKLNMGRAFETSHLSSVMTGAGFAKTTLYGPLAIMVAAGEVLKLPDNRYMNPVPQTGGATSGGGAAQVVASTPQGGHGGNAGGGSTFNPDRPG
jgi:hypothetical protein